MKKLLVSAFPIKSGVGTYSNLLFKLGFFDEKSFFKIKNSDDESGYSLIIKYDFNPHGLMTYLSTFVESKYSKIVQKYDFVHVTSPDFFHLSKYNKNMVGTVHDIFPLDDKISKRAYSVFYRQYFKKELKYLKNLRGIIVNSNHIKHKLELLFPDIDFNVIHLWTSDNFIYRDKTEARKKLSLPLDKIILLNVSSDQPRKNISILPKILNKLGDHYYLVRIGPSNKIKKEMKYKNYKFIDKVDDDYYPYYFNASDILLDPSKNEGFGRPIIEAINSDLPVIASNIDIFKEILGSDYKYFADYDNFEDWIDIIENFSTTKNVYSYQMKNYYREERAKTDYINFYKKIGVL
ncbi:MAG: glycosyltransferase [Candidatus Micrarchaeaceae archaeon]